MGLNLQYQSTVFFITEIIKLKKNHRVYFVRHGDVAWYKNQFTTPAAEGSNFSKYYMA